MHQDKQKISTVYSLKFHVWMRQENIKQLIIFEFPKRHLNCFVFYLQIMWIKICDITTLQFVLSFIFCLNELFSRSDYILYIFNTSF